MISDYKEHLHSVHNVSNFENCLKLTREKLEHEKKRKHFEEVTIDEKDEEQFVFKRKVEQRSKEEKLALELIKPLFNSFKLIEDNNVTNTDVEDDINDNACSDLLNSEKGITKYFMNIKEKIRKFEFERDMLDEILQCNIKSDKTDQLKLESTGEVKNKKTAAVLHSCDVCKITFGALSEEQVQAHMESHKTQLLHKIKTEVPLMPSRITKMEKRFLCPLPNCSFWVNKKGMMESKAAIHLQKDHMMKSKDMVRGQIKFNKISIPIEG